jgi:hypothetical protein
VVAPRQNKLTVLRKLHHAIILAMAIGHENIAVFPDCDTSRPVERIRTIPGHALLAKCVRRPTEPHCAGFVLELQPEGTNTSQKANR